MAILIGSKIKDTLHMSTSKIRIFQLGNRGRGGSVVELRTP